MSKRTKTDWPGEHKCHNVQKIIGQENSSVKTYKNSWARRIQVTKVSKRTKTGMPGKPKCQNVQKLIGQENPCVKTYKNKLVRRTQVSKRTKTDNPNANT